MKIYDNSALNCLTAGEDDDSANLNEVLRQIISHFFRFFSHFFWSFTLIIVNILLWFVNFNVFLNSLKADVYMRRI